jgi:hypothetical protein
LKKKKKKETKSKTKKQGKIRRRKKWGKLNFIKHITMTWYRTNLHFSTIYKKKRNRYNIIITMWKKQKGYVRNGKKKQKVAWEKLLWFSHAF